MSKIDPDEMKYEGADLEAMAAADNYYRWIASEIKPYIGDKVVEAGSGAGSFSKQILGMQPDEAIFVEPTKNMYKLLMKRVGALKSKQTKVQTLNAYTGEVIKKLGHPDSFVYINVFEHIEDDKAEIKMLSKALRKGGHIIIFVPALNALLSDFDRSIGHFRRYDKKRLRMLAEEAGLEVVRLKYFDFIGMAPWFVNFRLLKSKKIKPSAVEFYDKAAIPVIRTLESVIPAPVGKNLLLIAKKK